VFPFSKMQESFQVARQKCAEREAEEEETTCGIEARTGIVVFWLLFLTFFLTLATDIVILVHRAQGRFVF